MNKKFEFLITLLIFSLAILIGGAKNYVSAATVGRPLTSPEPGWQRIDDIDPNIRYSAGWNYYGTNGREYKSSVHCTNTVGSSYSFIFKGTSFRLVGHSKNYYNTDNALVSIDGQSPQRFSTVFPGVEYVYMTLYYTSPVLKNCYHQVTVTCNDPRYLLENDAIDIYGSVAPWSDNTLLLDNSSLNLKTGDVQTLIPSIIGNKYADKTITWTSSDNNVAVVDDNGNISALKNGTAVITAAVAGTNLKASCSVNVTGSDKFLKLRPVKYTAKPDGTVDVKVIMKDKEASESISIQYDNTKLKFINAEASKDVRLLKCKGNANAGTAMMNFLNKKFLNNDVPQYEIATLHFKALTPGKTHIKITDSDVSNSMNLIKTIDAAQCGEADILITEN